MPVFMLVLDGLADAGWPTPLALARKPNIDRYAFEGILGTLDIGYRGYVNSDFGYLNLLGCYSERDYPGRGYLEALGIGLDPGEEDVCIRANWATLDKDGNLLDRRAGRETLGLEELAGELEMEIQGVRIAAYPSAGHRVVLVLSGKGVSDQILPNDPMRTGVPVPEVRAKRPEGKKTAEVLNSFLREARKRLEGAEVNRKRRWPANCLLIRNVGRKRETESFRERWGLKGCCVAGIPIAKGVARWLGLEVIEVPGANGMPDTNLEGKFRAVERAFKRFELVWLHINATDILSHDARPGLKRAYIEKVDSQLGRLGFRGTFCLTCDHGTASSPDFKGYRHLPDPVPWLISGGVRPDGLNSFNEREAKRGRRLKGNELMGLLVKIYKDREQ